MFNGVFPNCCQDLFATDNLWQCLTTCKFWENFEQFYLFYPFHFLFPVKTSANTKCHIFFRPCLYLHTWQEIKDSEQREHPSFNSLHYFGASGKLRCCEKPPVIRQSCLCTVAPSHSSVCYTVESSFFQHDNGWYPAWWQLIVLLLFENLICATCSASVFRCINVREESRWFGWSASWSQCLFANRFPLCSYADPLSHSLRGRWIVPLACELQFESNNAKPEP